MGLNMFVRIKYLFSPIIALIMIVVLSPIYLLIAIAIKVDSRGAVFFKQTRRGLNGKCFKILKFRTMIVNAENVGAGIRTFAEDPRITRVGKFLRKTSLDEIPQLINILNGDMTFVGPRPVLEDHPYTLEEYSDFQVKRFYVKPGITGLAQVKVRNTVPWDERIELDVEYVEKQSLWLDIKILFLTVGHVLKFDVYSNKK